MREGDAGRISLADKLRPAIVMEVRERLVRVAYGTTSDDEPGTPVTVHPATSSGRRLVLAAVTHFYGANTAWIAPDELEPLGKPCTLELLHAVRKLVDEHDALVLDQ